MNTRTIRLLIGWLVISLLGTATAFSQSFNTLTPAEKKAGWVLLFDGVSTTGWTTTGGKPVPDGWATQNGTLTAKKGAKGGDIVSAGQYADFELSLDYDLAPEGNSGVKYFYTKYETGGNLGMEYQIIDDKLAEDNKKANHLTGSFYDVLPVVVQKKVNEPGRWNTLRIVANGKRVEHWLNGVKLLEFVRGSPSFTEGVSASKFSKTVPAFGTVDKGHILLQEHGGEISFRNIKIKAL